MNLFCIKKFEKEKTLEKKSTTKTMINESDFEMIKNNNSYCNQTKKRSIMNCKIRIIRRSYSLNNISDLKSFSNLQKLYWTKKRIENLKPDNKFMESFLSKYTNNQSPYTKVKKIFGKSNSNTCSSELIIIDYPNHTEEKNIIKTNAFENEDDTKETINKNMKFFKGNWKNIAGDSDITEMHSQDFENENKGSINYIKRKNIPYFFMKINENKYIKKINKIPKYIKYKGIKNTENKNTQKNIINNCSNFKGKLINEIPIKTNVISQKSYKIKNYILNINQNNQIQQKTNSQNILSKTINFNNNRLNLCHKKDLTGNILKKKIKHKTKNYIKKVCTKYINTKKQNAKTEKINLNYLFIKNTEIPREAVNLNFSKKFIESSGKIQMRKNKLLSENLLSFKKKLAINKISKKYLNAQITTSQLKNTYKVKSIIKKTLILNENFKDCEITFQKTNNTENFDDNQKKMNIISSNNSTFNTVHFANVKNTKNCSKDKAKIDKYGKLKKNKNSDICFSINKNSKIKYKYNNNTYKIIRNKDAAKKNG